MKNLYLHEGHTTVESSVSIMELNIKFAEVSKDGRLVLLDNTIIRQHTKDNPYAIFILAILDAAAKEVDHILAEGGGTYGDKIRNLNIIKEILE